MEMYSAIINDSLFQVEKKQGKLIINEEILDWDLIQTEPRHYHLLHQGISYNVELVSIKQEEKSIQIKLNNKPCEIKLKDRFDLLLEKLGMNQPKNNSLKEIKAPMPGLILELKVKEGDEVKAGDPILILEAMKMENLLKAPGDGLVKALRVKKGDSVEKNQVLIQF